jgi:acetyl-CoA carboxylase biotin carboxyl carrier protein
MSGLSRDDIDEILRLVDDSSFDELRLEVGDTKIEITRRRERATADRTAPPARSSSSSAPPRAAPAPAAAPPVRTAGPAPTPDGVIDVPAPQLGIFYHAPRPGEPPFVSIGDVVTPDTTIGIIEVMKLMNTVAAGVGGTVVEIVAPNGESVRQGDTLIRVRPTAGHEQGEA